MVLDVMLNNNIVGLSEGAGEKEAGEKRRGMGEGGWWNVRGEEEKKAREEQMRGYCVLFHLLSTYVHLMLYLSL